jgi:hypothetical protein
VELKTILINFVKGFERVTAAAFFRDLPIVLIREKISKASEQEGPKPAFFRVDTVQEIPVHASGEKLLDEVFGVLMGVAPRTKPLKDRLAIGLAESVKRGFGFISRTQNQTPMRESKQAGICRSSRVRLRRPSHS